MQVFFSKLETVNDLSELPENVIIHIIDGNKVAGICGACHDPVFEEDDHVVEHDEHWHNKCIGSHKIVTEMSSNKESTLKDIATEFYYSWHNSPGSNTSDGFDDWWKMNKVRFGF